MDITKEEVRKAELGKHIKREEEMLEVFNNICDDHVAHKLLLNAAGNQSRVILPVCDVIYLGNNVGTPEQELKGRMQLRYGLHPWTQLFVSIHADKEQTTWFLGQSKRELRGRFAFIDFATYVEPFIEGMSGDMLPSEYLTARLLANNASTVLTSDVPLLFRSGELEGIVKKQEWRAPGNNGVYDRSAATCSFMHPEFNLENPVTLESPIDADHIRLGYDKSMEYNFAAIGQLLRDAEMLREGPNTKENHHKLKPTIAVKDLSKLSWYVPLIGKQTTIPINAEIGKPANLNINDYV